MGADASNFVSDNDDHYLSDGYTYEYRTVPIEKAPLPTVEIENSGGLSSLFNRFLSTERKPQTIPMETVNCTIRVRSKRKLTDEVEENTISSDDGRDSVQSNKEKRKKKRRIADSASSSKTSLKTDITQLPSSTTKEISSSIPEDITFVKDISPIMAIQESTKTASGTPKDIRKPFISMVNALDTVIENTDTTKVNKVISTDKENNFIDNLLLELNHFRNTLESFKSMANDKTLTDILQKNLQTELPAILTISTEIDELINSNLTKDIEAMVTSEVNTIDKTIETLWTIYKKNKRNVIQICQNIHYKIRNEKNGRGH